MVTEVENFEETMLKLKKHFSTRPSEREFATVEHLLGRPVNRELAAAATLPQDAQATIDTYQGTMNDDNGSRETNMTTAVDDYQANKDQSDFEKKMNGHREQDLANAQTNINNMYDGLIKSGNANPASQSAIETATVAISEFTDKIWHSFTDFVVNLVNNIVQWVQQAFDKVKDWVSGAVDSVGNFFGSLF